MTGQGFLKIRQLASVAWSGQVQAYKFICGGSCKQVIGIGGEETARPGDGISLLDVAAPVLLLTNILFLATVVPDCV